MWDVAPRAGLKWPRGRSPRSSTIRPQLLRTAVRGSWGRCRTEPASVPSAKARLQDHIQFSDVWDPSCALLQNPGTLRVQISWAPKIEATTVWTPFAWEAGFLFELGLQACFSTNNYRFSKAIGFCCRVDHKPHAHLFDGAAQGQKAQEGHWSRAVP